jgi:hypothetical protein
MSSYPSAQRCPRCQNLVPPGATACPTCGLALAGAPGAAPGANPLYPLPPTQPGSGASYGTMPAANYGSSQQATVYSPQTPMESAPTVAGSLYPQDANAPGAGSYQNAYPGSQPQGGYPGSAPAYPGSQPQNPYPGSAPAYPGSQPQGGYSASAPAYPGSQPQGGYSGSAPTFPSPAPTYPGSQPQGGYSASPPPFPGTAPTYPGSQPQGGFGMPPAPGMAPQMPQTPGRGRGLRIAIILIVVLVLVGGGGGTAAYLLTRPKPVITVTSQFKSGSTYAGSTTTTFQVTGQKFSSNSAITFLLDDKDLSGTAAVTSDDNGAISAKLTVPADWNVGNHVLKARDASGYETQAGATIAICAQGDCGTPGPNGAPSNTAPSFILSADVQRQDATDGSALNPFVDKLTINNGQVCDDRFDDGQPHSDSGTTSDGTGYTETIILKCTGTYQAGKLSYTETASSYQIKYNNGVTCTSTASFVNQKLDGTFSSATAASGNYSSDGTSLVCTAKNGQQITVPLDPEKGTFTGTVG